jgi:uncharacterized protein (DUF58 family)
MKSEFNIFSFHFSKLFYLLGSISILLMALGYFSLPLLNMGILIAAILCGVVLLDLFLLHLQKQPATSLRHTAARWSNGDPNSLVLDIENRLWFSTCIKIIDELPMQLGDEIREEVIYVSARSTQSIQRQLQPNERGVYEFGDTNLFVRGFFQLVYRHLQVKDATVVAVYPSFMMARRFQLMAITGQLQEAGQRQLRKTGNSLEFEQIKEYTQGDDYRTINWRATARRGGNLMVNQFMDERSQQIICIIDKGRTMKMPFNGMTLLDHAINASLVLSSVALMRQDRAGLVLFGKKVDQVLLPEKQKSQLGHILETLYKQTTQFLNADFEALYSTLRYKVKQRSLLVLFTNFESMYGLQRQMPYLKKISSHHLLLVVIFKNTALKEMVQQEAASIQDIYQQVTAERFVQDKKLMLKELHGQGIPALLTTPEKLTVTVINKYLEMKAKQQI